ncbi:unnamed protein product [Sphenostylis stenocarpa]|uniref:TIR domain-containing protein n=1 Tax=Sphenostylis stenocarpa TaxID=92480 RepID=A0AA86T4X7_9FABA|nr:unnamed protein product [Sphenostylis stenocarpa]
MSSSFAEKHDVFLSFRGEDTRSNFTSHLYTALLQKSITTFIDYKLIRGDYAWPTLSRAIDESVVSIVVFSENYASSTWCLKELVHILECRRKRGLVVIPVFYKVDPTHIRKLRGSYEKAFAKHERDPTLSNRKSHRQDVSRWKAALKEASNISGWDSRSYRKDHVIRILDACGFEATSGVDVLEDKALITISNRNIIQMHDLLLKMGLEIVRQESSGHPGSRSRLKDDEAREVIEQNEGTGAIQGIALDLSQIKGLILYADTFTKMKTLRFLKFYTSLGESASDTYLDLPTTLDPFSDKLRYIEWIGYPFESLPSPFCAKFLVEIHMPRSKVKQLWQGIQELDNLEGIDLRQCKQFEELPDLSKAPRLKWVILTGCESLQYLHPSVLSSDTLVTLILDRCTNLKRVKSEKHLKSLEKISVNGCLNLEEFAVSSDLIENLDLSNTGIQTLDTSIGSMYKLKWLNLEGLKLKHLLKELSCLTSLKVLKISDNGLVMDKQKIHVLFDGLRYLEILYLKDCSKLFELPDNISFLTQLRELRLDRSDVKRLPESVKNLHKLEILSLENCKELFCLPKFPSLIKYLRAINCTSLVSVSNLKTLATEMLGMTKRITFKNSCQLDGHSLKLIMESLHLTMLSAAYHNVLVRRSYGSYHSYNYTAVELCLPGGSVPEKIHYRSTKSSITIVLPPRSDLLGFIYSVVLSPAGGRKTYGTKINCKCHLPEEGIMETWLYSDIRELKSDHVYVWYDPLHCDSILKYHERPKVFFEFNVANDKGEVDGSICIEECGVGLVSVSEVESVLQELDFDSDKKKELMEGVELESKLGNQQRDWSEWSSSDSPTSLTSSSESDSEMVEPDLAEKGKYTHKETKTDSGINAVKHEGNKEAPIKSDATLHETVESHSDNENKFREKSITQSKVAVMVELETESTCKETQSTAKRHPKEESTESTQVDKIRLSERKRTESDVGLHQPTVSVNESNASKEDNSSEINCDWPDTNIQEVNYSEANEYLHAGEILVHHDIHDVNVAEEPNHENERENRGTDHCFRAEGEDGSDEDPFAELDSILLRSPKSSAKATSTTDVAVSEALHNLNFLLENSLDCILGDTELQQELLTTLEFIKEASQEKVSPNVAKLVEGITSSIDYLFKDFPSTQNVVEAHTSHLLQKQKLVQQVRDAKKQKELLNKEMRQYRFETERLGKKAEKLDEMIQLFTEQKKSVELKRAKLKETLEKCEGEKKKLKQEAKNKVTESKEIMLVIENSKASYDAALSKQQMLNDKWEGFRTAFADNCGTLVAHDS